MNRLRRLLRITSALVGAAAIVVIIGWMSGWFHPKIAPGMHETELRSLAGRDVAQAESFEAEESVVAVGTVRPRRETDVAAQILATILSVEVNPGDTVEAGQTLITLDDREIETQLRTAEAGLTAAETDLAVQKKDYDRYKSLLAENAVARADFEQIEGGYLVAQTRVRQAREQIARADVMQSYAKIQAPGAGVVADRYADPGDLAAPGKPLLSIHDPTELELHASVRESLAGKLKPGMVLPVRIDATELDLDGTVREIVPQADAASRSVLVKVSLPSDKTAGLYVGMFGRLSIPVGATRCVAVAADAVQHVGQLDLVDKVIDGESLDRRFVRTGRLFGEKVEILSGLRQGDEVALPHGVTPVVTPREAR